MINKKNIITGKAGISYFQILMIVLSSIAISYLLYSSTGMVSAAAAGTVCCEKTKNNAICQNDKPENCDDNFRKSPTECKDTDYCELGCCVSQESGICNENTPKRSCDRTDYKESANCNVAECKKGCCFVGEAAEWTTEKNCKIKSDFRGIPLNFSKEIKSEIKCIFEAEKDKKGACVLETENGRSCKYITLEECNTRLRIKNTVNPNFHAEKFCSNSQLNTTCRAKDHKGCFEGKEDVYWFDSCGNPEDIATDCDIFRGSYCGKSGTNYLCKDINCYVDGEKRRNGESWCEYDGTIGSGKDPVGSRHIKHICFMGEEKIEPCADYRNEICVQKDSSTNDGEPLSQAACKVNNWRACYSYNQLEESKLIEKCEKETDCFVMDVSIDKNFKFKACVPQYPPGFNFETLNQEEIENDKKTAAESNCAIATQTCVETWKKCLIGGWKCIDNCNCHSAAFTNKMNEFCASLGDCGAWVNYNGDVTEGGYGLKAEKQFPPRLTQAELSTIKSYAEPNPGQKPADPGDITLEETLNVQNLETISGYEGLLAGVSGSLGSPLLAKILSSDNKNMSNIISETSPSAVNYAQYSSASFSSIARGIGESNKKAPNAMIGAAIGGAIGFGLGYLLQLGTTMSLVLAVAIALIIFLFLSCKIKKFKVTFQCNQWERPAGGDCNACNRIDVPCTRYRCESSGQTCKLINEGTTEQMCIDKCRGNESIPEIRPWNGLNGSLPSTGYIYRTITDGFEIAKPDGSCIDPYTKVNFGIRLVDDNDPNAECKFSQCKIGTDASQPYEEMTNFFGDRSSFLPYHKADVFFPSPESLRHQYNLSDETIRELSTMNFYVKCKSSTGQVNPQPYKIKTCISLGPDLIAPVITGTIPRNGEYVQYGKDRIELQVFANEPSNCRYSNISKGYDQMENQMNCETDLLQYTDFGWACNTTLKNISEKIYIRCRDISENNNTMSDSYEYSLLQSSSALSIASTKPSNGEEILSGVEPVNIVLRAETSGGAENGKAVCEWKGNGYSDYFTETNSNFHSYEWKYATRGNYNLNFYCEDIAGNNATAVSSFLVTIDDFGPRITRIYKSGGLKIVTNENAECRYGFSRRFDFANATLMDGNELEHDAEWKSTTYYVQCSDKYGNKGGVMQIKAYELG